MGSDFLFAMPTFLRGAASALDLGGTFVEYNISNTTTEADSRALRSDWQTVGADLRCAMKKVDAKTAR